MRPNKLNDIKTEQLKALGDEQPEQAPRPKKPVAKNAKQPSRVTKLDVIKKKHNNKAVDAAPATPVSKLLNIKTTQLDKDPTVYDVKTHVVAAPGAGNVFEQLQAAMQTDIARLKTHKVMANKNALKATLIPNYWPFVEDYMDNEHDYPNSVAVQLMVWLLDVGDIEQALDVGQYLMNTGNQHLPANFKCDIPTLISRSMYDWANDCLKKNQSADPYLTAWVLMVEMNNVDLPIAVESGLLVMAAKHAIARDRFAECLEYCEKAQTLNPDGAGVKTLKAKAEKELKKKG